MKIEIKVTMDYEDFENIDCLYSEVDEKVIEMIKKGDEVVKHYRMLVERDLISNVCEYRIEGEYIEEDE